MLVMTDEFKSHFGNDYYVGVLTHCDNHFTKENLTTLRKLSNELLDSLSYADKVTSLTDIEFMVGSEDGMTIEQIVPDCNCARPMPITPTIIGIFVLAGRSSSGVWPTDCD